MKSIKVNCIQKLIHDITSITFLNKPLLYNVQYYLNDQYSVEHLIKLLLSSLYVGDV